MRYPPQFLDRIRQHFRLSEVIGRRLQIRKAGREFHALCPFHNEKTPSFTISDSKGFYHCFGCGAHGDVIGFIKDYERLSWPQAVEALAREAGLDMPTITPEMREIMDRGEVLYGTVEKAAQWFAQQLNRAGGTGAREYLARRGVRQESIAAFRIGYAPEARDGLKSALLGLNVPLRDVEEAGLLTQPETGTSYDKFRGRIIFPIRDSAGRVVGFGGRLMAEAGNAPKYLNSPQTALFDKGRLLYNADTARAAAARTGELLVAEGYMDVIALHQAGFTASVAPLGTAVTEEHLRLLWQMAEEPVFCLDGDSAGQRAMQRVASLAIPLLGPGKSLRFCLLPAGEDPDSLIASRGAAAMREAIASAIPLVEMLWRLEVQEKPNATPEQRARAERSVLRAVENIQDGTVRRAYIKEMKQRLWEAGRSGGTRGKAKPAGLPPTFDTAALRASVAGVTEAGVRRDTCIRRMISILLRFPSLLERPDIEADFIALAPTQDALARFHQEWVAAHMSGAWHAETAKEAETRLWQGGQMPFELRQLLKLTEAEGMETAALSYLRLASQLQEIQLAEEFPTAADMDNDVKAACARRSALQQQLLRLQTEAALRTETPIT